MMSNASVFQLSSISTNAGAKRKKSMVRLIARFLALQLSFSLLLSVLPACAQTHNPQPARTPAQPLVDDTIILTLASGADNQKVKEVLDEVHGTVVRTLHINKENYSILFVKPEKGKEEDTIKKILSKKD